MILWKTLFLTMLSWIPPHIILAISAPELTWISPRTQQVQVAVEISTGNWQVATVTVRNGIVIASDVAAVPVGSIVNTSSAGSEYHAVINTALGQVRFVENQAVVDANGAIKIVPLVRQYSTEGDSFLALDGTVADVTITTEIPVTSLKNGVRDCSCSRNC